MPKTKPEPARRGRPPIAAHLQRVSCPLRLPRWIVEWIDAQGSARSDVIEAALVKAHKLKEPQA